MRSLGILVTFAICAVAAITLSCSSTPANTPTPPAQTAATPAPSTDYLGAGVKMVGIRTASWQGDLYTVPFYTAVILQDASPETKNQAHVRPTGKVADSSDTEFWTPYVVASHPAAEEELRPGVLVFAMGDAAPRSRDTLANTTAWSLQRVKDTSDLFKGVVTLEYHDTYWNTWKENSFHVANIRVVEGELSTELAE